MNTGHVPPEEKKWVTSQEGIQLLEIGRGTFFHLVKTGQIQKESGRGPRSGRYLLQDIVEIQKRRAKGKKRKPYKKRTPQITIDWLRTTDVPAVLKLDYTVYHEMYLADAQHYVEWRGKNVALSKAAFLTTDRNVCLGYIGLLPLPETTIIDILTGKRDETSITADDIETYDRPGAYTLLANSAVIHPDYPGLLLLLIRAIIDFWVDEQYPERYARKIYVQAVSERGDLFVQLFRMAPRYDLAENAFELDLTRPGLSRIIRDFQKRIAAKAPLPPELKRDYAT
ncbi:MAG: hypothetical protein ACRDHW_08290 [Ktedonobacteraceae bacterium]